MRRRSIAALALVVASATTAACGTDDGAGAQPGSADSASPAVPNATTSATTGPVPATAERIIPVNGDLAEIVYALGMGDQVVATDISATYPPAADASPKIGYQRTLTAETILSFDPTIILADDLAGPPEVLDQLRDTGVRVVEIPREDTIDAPAAKIRAVAAALGVPERGAALVATLDAQLADAHQRAEEAVAAAGRPKVLALYLRGTAVQLVFGKGSGIDAIIDAAGGTDLGTAMGITDNAELSVEAVIEAAPDVLLVTTTGLETVGGVDGLLALPGLDQTPAGINGRVAVFEDQFLYGLGPRTGQLVGELVAAFHQPSPTPDTTPGGSTATTATGTATATATADRGVGQTTSAGPNAGPRTATDTDAATTAWTTAFDSSVAFVDKAEFIAAAESVRPTLKAYATLGEQMGGITLVVTDVVVNGDTATLTYDIHFAGLPAYSKQTGAVERVAGRWVVSHTAFCDFMALARTACPADD